MKTNYQMRCKECDGTGESINNDAEVHCNMCGNSMKIDEDFGNGKSYFNGLVDAQVNGGYHSYHLLDMTTYSFDMCEECLRKLFTQFKIPPHVYDHMDHTATWEHDQKAYEYRIWKDNGGAHQAYLNGMCNAIKDCPNKAVHTIQYDGEFSEDCCCNNNECQQGAIWTTNAGLVPFISNVLKPFL